MKQSYYNFVLNYDEHGKTMLYNSLTNGTIVLANDEFTNNVLPVLNDCHQQDANTEVAKFLYENRFIVDDETDEFEIIKNRFNEGKVDEREMLLTIATTSQCNFRCTYCFENHKNAYLNEDNFSKLFEIIKVKSSKSQAIDITWFGGEPMLTINQIHNWSNRLIEYCKITGKTFRASIVTNGSLLTEKNVRLLQESNIAGIQVTIDGDKSIHDRKRPKLSGKGTFDQIIENLVRNQEVLRKMNVSIRVNVDKDNSESLENLVQDLAQRGFNDWVYLYFSKVEASTEYCGDIGGSCFSSKEFSSKLANLNRMKVRYGFNSKENPKLIKIFCSALSKNSFLIDADGDIFRCWNDVGNKAKRTTTISDEWNRIVSLGEYENYSPYDDLECATCKFLPICQGNCPFHRVNGRKKTCTELKYNLKEHFEILYSKDLKG